MVQACRFPPNGNRGFGFVYPDQLAQGAEAAIDEANEKTVVILQIESRNAVENVGAIAATPGVDGLWVGEFDLSISLGVPGEIAHQDVIAAEAAVVRTCERAGISAGVLVSHADAARDRIARGFRTIAVGSDIGLYGQALRESLGALAGQKQ